MHRAIATSLLLTSTIGLSLALGGAARAQSAQARTHLGGRASGIVVLKATADPGATVPLQVQNPDGSIGGAFELPPGTALVVTDLVASLNSDGSPTGLTRGGLAGGAGQSTRPYFSFYGATQGGDSEHFTTGVVWTVTPSLVNAGDSGDSVFVDVTGYLVKNK